MRLLFTLTLFCTCLFSFAQETEEQADARREIKVERNKSFSLFTSVDLTYTGYSSVLALEYERKKHSFYLGPKISISHTYLFHKSPYGGVIGYRYFFLSDLKRWKVYFNTDYQMYIFKSFNGQNQKGTLNNYIHEISLGYGIQFKISRRFYISNSISIGKYFESYYNSKSEDRTNLNGYNSLLRLFLKYQL
ncbi:MAG TPA: hypothetical protein VF691_01175 [Cytophagaceae bacterium]|jgi:hypothetical protein